MTMTRLSSILAALAVLLMVCGLAAVVLVMVTGAYTGQAYPVDFAAFWGAAHFAVEGRASDAFDPDLLQAFLAIPKESSDKVWIWAYPPMWHVAVWPLGYLPFWLAYPIYAAAALVIYMLALRPYAGFWPGGLNLVLAAPVVVIGTMNANNGLLTAGILVLALTALGQGRATRAGLLIALLSVKPMVGLLLPVALVAGGHWRAFLWALTGALGFAAAATAIMGVEYWAAFFDNARVVADRIARGDFPLDVTVSWFGFGWGIGLGSSAAFWLQGLATLMCVLITGWVWARRVPWLWKAAVLLLLTPMATPYAHFYEMAFTLAGTVLMVGAGAGRAWVDRCVIAGLWLLPACSLYLRDPPVVNLLAAPLASLAVAICITRMRSAWTRAPAPS